MNIGASSRLIRNAVGGREPLAECNGQASSHVPAAICPPGWLVHVGISIHARMTSVLRAACAPVCRVGIGDGLHDIMVCTPVLQAICGQVGPCDRAWAVINVIHRTRPPISAHLLQLLHDTVHSGS